ncbi:MAG: hypothetical protein SFX18_17240 [Pirellulales bacterium]|nr:hypothetical protein [Pirellulales bacterium]
MSSLYCGMLRHVTCLAITCALGSAGCHFTSKRDLSVLLPGTTRSLVRERLGPPARVVRHRGQDIDIYAFYQGYSLPHQLLTQPATHIADGVSAFGQLLINSGDTDFNPPFPEPRPGDPAKIADWEKRKREFEKLQVAHRDHADQRDEIAAAEAAKERQRQAEIKAGLANVGLEERDLQPENLAEVYNEPLHYRNSDEWRGGKNLAFAVNYDERQCVQTVAFKHGLAQARQDTFGMWSHRWLGRKCDFPLQQLEESIFFAMEEGKMLNGEQGTTVGNISESQNPAPGIMSTSGGIVEQSIPLQSESLPPVE